MSRRLLYPLVSFTMLLAGTGCPLATLPPPVEGADLKFDPAHAKAPPRVEAATIEPLAQATAAGNAVVRIQFADRRSKTPVVIEGGSGPTLLRDDGVAPDRQAGDGNYAAVVRLNVEQYSQALQRRIELASRYRDMPVFAGRQLLRNEPFRPARIERVPGIPSTLDRFEGVPFAVDPARALLITSVQVVEDPKRTFDACSKSGTPMGAWTFGKLVTEIANQPVTGIDPADLAEGWINQWKANLAINGFTVPERAMGAQRFLDSWPRLPGGKLDLARSPFRLLAIVNRQDLRGSTLYGARDAGEARLVFGALNCGGIVSTPPTPPVMPFTVIFEYGIRKNSCVDVRDWARQWNALGALVLGSVPYNAALQALTDQFTLRNANPAQSPNRSAINQVRTNEFALARFPASNFWQLRESLLRSAGAEAGQLRHATIAQTPDRLLQGTTTLRDFINGREAAILAGKHSVPLQFPVPSPFRGGHIDQGAGFGWTAPAIANSEARHRFSLATCSGCHKHETATESFLHIAPRALGAPAALSDFLTGQNMPKNIDGVMRTFHDLLDRQAKLDATANMSCLRRGDFPLEEIFFEPVPFVH